jgi:lipoprotein-anchoring transpeptidase ErfK/SrfK
MDIVSTAVAPYDTPYMQPGADGSHGEMGRVFGKDPDAFSHEYQVHMLWWLAITSSGSHGIHATSPNLYDYLGEPASHGCIRQTVSDAHSLYERVSVGTRVYVK